MLLFDDDENVVAGADDDDAYDAADSNDNVYGFNGVAMITITMITL